MPGTLANVVPTASDPGALMRMVKDLQRQIDELRSARSLAASAIGAGGTVEIDGGNLVVKDGSGNILALIGTDSNGLIGVQTYTATGHRLFASLGHGEFGLKYTATFDTNSLPIILDDALGGLNRPRLSLGQWVDYTALGTPAAPTTSATFVTLQALFAYEQNPRVRVDVMVSSSSAGTTGEVQVLDPLGNIVGSALTVAANTTATATLGPVTLTGYAFGTSGYFLLQARRTAGTGTIGARGLGAWGGGSGDTV